jgi:hypothetical protein
MSNSISNTPRIVRGKPPKARFTENTYRKAKPYLIRDFQNRCAYSQQHSDRSLGTSTMEIDHFNPTLTGAARHRYSNLFLATHHCNGAKSNTWPKKSARRKGVYIINPCEELDFGAHIFEHPITHRLVGVTPAGIYHVAACDLNAIHLVAERQERAAIYKLLEETPVTLRDDVYHFPSQAAALLREQFNKMIPLIPYLSTDHPAYDEELRIVAQLWT